MSRKSKLDRGIEMYVQLRGEDAARSLIDAANGKGILAERSRWTLQSCFGEIWNRPGLDLRSRSLVTIGMLIGLGLSEELTNHFRIGIRNGLSDDELMEIVFHAAAYVGLPGSAFAVRALNAVLAENSAI